MTFAIANGDVAVDDDGQDDDDSGDGEADHNDTEHWPRLPLIGKDLFVKSTALEMNHDI